MFQADERGDGQRVHGAGQAEGDWVSGLGWAVCCSSGGAACGTVSVTTKAVQYDRVRETMMMILLRLVLHDPHAAHDGRRVVVLGAP